MQTIWLEFKHKTGNLAANGTDVTFYIDGRWSWNTTREMIYSRVEELRDIYPKYKDQLFVGYTVQGGREGAIHSMPDRDDPPEWARKQADNGS